MSKKVVLVMDMPKNCASCKLADWSYCILLKKAHAGKGIQEDCPLKPLPEKQNLTFAMYGEDMIALGWNVCIEALEDDLK